MQQKPCKFTLVCMAFSFKMNQVISPGTGFCVNTAVSKYIAPCFVGSYDISIQVCVKLTSTLRMGRSYVQNKIYCKSIQCCGIIFRNKKKVEEVLR